jgi:hypothetical protein
MIELELPTFNKAIVRQTMADLRSKVAQQEIKNSDDGQVLLLRPRTTKPSKGSTSQEPYGCRSRNKFPTVHPTHAQAIVVRLKHRVGIGPYKKSNQSRAAGNRSPSSDCGHATFSPRSKTTKQATAMTAAHTADIG